MSITDGSYTAQTSDVKYTGVIDGEYSIPYYVYSGTGADILAEKDHIKYAIQ